ncbi:glycosyltransferase [bacterium]|nr:glycosyltransferase [bacterium]
MFILLLNQCWFAEELRAKGHEVVSVGFQKGLDVTLSMPFQHIDSIVTEHLGGRVPDVIVVLDESSPIHLVGLSESRIPLLFFSVDAHHHYQLHGDIAKAMDWTLVAQKNLISPINERGGVEAEWMPLWASRYVEPQEEKEFGAVFVGSLNRELNPDRVQFFEALQARIDLLCKTGSWWDIFPRSEIVINQTVKRDLNFRVFEAMMSGALLITERTSNGLLSLFTDGEHLVTYEKGDVEEAAEKISYYLQHKEEARRIAAAGRERILQEHLPVHRANRIEELCRSLRQRPEKPQKHVGWLSNYNALSTRLNNIDLQLAKHANVFAMQSAERVVLNKEPLNEDMTFLLVYACCSFDRFHQTSSGRELLQQALCQYPNSALIRLAIIRSFLNDGQVNKARRLAEEVGDPEKLYQSAETVITELLDIDSKPVGLLADKALPSG